MGGLGAFESGETHFRNPTFKPTSNTETMATLIRYLKKERPRLKLYAPGEPGQHEQLTWLVRFIQVLKGDVKRLEAEKAALVLQVKGNASLTPDEQELLDLRYQVQMLWYENAKLQQACTFLGKRNKELNRELDERDWEMLGAA